MMATETIELAPNSSVLPAPLAAHWQAAITAAARAWNNHPRACLSFRVAPPVDQWLAKADGLNLIVLRTTAWCHNARCDHQNTFPLRALAMTSPYPPNTAMAAPQEADIELNAKTLHLDDGALAIQGHDGPIPVSVILTHELGHVLGLPDLCLHANAGGGPLALCPPDYLHRVMFAENHLNAPSDADWRDACSLRTGSTVSSASTQRTSDPALAWAAPVLAILLSLLCVAWWRAARPHSLTPGGAE